MCTKNKKQKNQQQQKQNKNKQIVPSWYVYWSERIEGRDIRMNSEENTTQDENKKEPEEREDLQKEMGAGKTGWAWKGLFNLSL